MDQQQKTIVSLACLMGLVTAGSEGYTDSGGEILDAALVADNYKKAVIDGTLVRKIEHFDADNLLGHRKTDFLDHQAVFVMLKRDVPKQLPEGWSIRELSDGKIEVTTAGTAEFWFLHTTNLLLRRRDSCHEDSNCQTTTILGFIHEGYKWHCLVPVMQFILWVFLGAQW